MTDRIEREVRVQAPAEQVWDAVIGDGWLADEVELDLVPGGDAAFRWDDMPGKDGWVEDVRAPFDAADGAGRLAFWWASDDEPATRVELTLTPDGSTATVVRVAETRPLDRLDLVGTPLPGAGGQRSYGPALVAA
jgi:uncharacterized protein YndB with AHSA1/START domain